jgi:hypothetical protein
MGSRADEAVGVDQANDHTLTVLRFRNVTVRVAGST